MGRLLREGIYFTHWIAAPPRVNGNNKDEEEMDGKAMLA